MQVSITLKTAVRAGNSVRFTSFIWLLATSYASSPSLSSFFALVKWKTLTADYAEVVARCCRSQGEAKWHGANLGAMNH